MNVKTVMQNLEELGTDFTKKRYLSAGAREPLFGTPTGKMKPMSKEIGQDQVLAEKLYQTGNYDAMYFAGIIAEPNTMTEADYERWMDDAYFYMLSDFVVAVTLSEADIAQELSDKWINSGDELRMSAGWSCYCWLLGSQQDNQFSTEKLQNMLNQIEVTLAEMPPHAKDAMLNFIYTVGTSYLPLHNEATELAEKLGKVTIEREEKKPKVINAYANIQKMIDKDKIGFKRRYVRC